MSLHTRASLLDILGLLRCLDDCPTTIWSTNLGMWEILWMFWLWTAKRLRWGSVERFSYFGNSNKEAENRGDRLYCPPFLNKERFQWQYDMGGLLVTSSSFCFEHVDEPSRGRNSRFLKEYLSTRRYSWCNCFRPWLKIHFKVLAGPPETVRRQAKNDIGSTSSKKTKLPKLWTTWWNTK